MLYQQAKDLITDVAHYRTEYETPVDSELIHALCKVVDALQDRVKYLEGRIELCVGAYD